MPPPPQTTPSSYQWGTLYDMVRRLGASSVNANPSDALQIIQKISAFAYTRYLWPFTMVTSPIGSIPCVNKLQDYPAPADLFRLSRAWFRVPTYGPSQDDGTVPPYDDPNPLALAAAELSADYVGSLQYGGGTPSATIWPPTGSLLVVKRLPINLYPYAYTQIRQITQQPNQNMLRLTAATAVALNNPYYLELEYQPVRPKVNALTEYCWFPDDYVSMAQEGILYELYRYNNDPRAGTTTFQVGRPPAYSGQLAVWMASMESAAAAEREGSVDTITPSESIGADYGNWNGWFA